MLNMYRIDPEVLEEVWGAFTQASSVPASEEVLVRYMQQGCPARLAAATHRHLRTIAAHLHDLYQREAMKDEINSWVFKVQLDPETCLPTELKSQITSPLRAKATKEER